MAAGRHCFTASIVLPLIKLFGLTWMPGRPRGSSRMLVERTRLYRSIDTVGRWSNIDISVSVLVAILQFGSLTAVHAGAGLVAFAAVVIITMLAAIMVFDSRLMWDVRENTRMTDSTENGEPTRGRQKPRHNPATHHSGITYVGSSNPRISLT